MREISSATFTELINQRFALNVAVLSQDDDSLFGQCSAKLIGFYRDVNSHLPLSCNREFIMATVSRYPLRTTRKWIASFIVALETFTPVQDFDETPREVNLILDGHGLEKFLNISLNRQKCVVAVFLNTSVNIQKCVWLPHRDILNSQLVKYNVGLIN